MAFGTTKSAYLKGTSKDRNSRFSSGALGTAPATGGASRNRPASPRPQADKTDADGESQPAAARTKGRTCSLPARRSRRAATARVQPESV